MRRLLVIVFAASLAAVVGLAVPAQAGHSMGIHWARTANPFTVQIDDNVDAVWDAKLATAAADWATSSVVNTNINQGSFGSKADCDPAVGHVEVCNAKYGNEGWTGFAAVYYDANGHIVRGLVKLNDTYLNRGSYPDAYDQLVVCQELGHNLGLAHQDEVQTNPNLGTCMDYTNDADGPPSNEHPNTHDFDLLESIYAHTDSYSTTSADGARVVTFITWA